MDVETPRLEDFCFGRCRVVPRRRELEHDGKVIEIGDRAFELLLTLVNARGSALSKDRLMALVWPGRIVEENTLESQISILRRALGDDRAAIRTVAGRGYQFVGELVEKAAPSLALTLWSLPASVSRLIGRETPLREVTELATSYRLITLVGSGGVGKTRLAIEAARQLVQCFPDGVCLVELGSTTSAQFLPMTIARALGFPPGEGTPSLDRIAAEIRHRRLLLVLDNCEHLIEGTARMAETLLHTLPNATIIATSREALRIAGEYIYRVASLDVPPDENSADIQHYGAIQLLEERVGSKEFCYGDTDRMLALKARICRNLDGIPLAIELAAARVPVFGLQGVADRLDDRFELLTQGARTALPRQQTLRATLDWSYELLSASEQIVLDQLSIFADGFSIDSAQAVVGTADIPPDKVVACVISLINRSMISPGLTADQVRYRLLETTRAYAREKLQARGILHDLSMRHARYYLALFQRAQREAESRADIDWSSAYAPHLEDLRAAINWSFSNGGHVEVAVDLTIATVAFSIQLSLLEESLARVNAALSLLDQHAIADDQRRMKLYAARGACLLYQTSGPETGATFNTALELAERVGDTEYQMRGLWGSVCYSYLNGLYAETLEFARRFGKLAAASSHSSDQFVACRLTGSAHLLLGELDEARTDLDRAVAGHVSLSRAQRIQFIYDEKTLANGVLSHTLWCLGLPDQAMRAAGQALASAHELDHPPSLSYALSEGVCPIALLNGAESELHDAVVELTQATRRHGVSTWKARGRIWQAFLDLQAGRLETYEEVIKPAISEIGGAGRYFFLTPLLSAVGITLGLQGRVTDGLAVIVPAIQRARLTGDECSLIELMRVQGELLLVESGPSSSSIAETLFSEALSVAHRRHFLAWELRCATSLAALWHRQGKSREARRLLRDVYDAFSEGWGTADLVAARDLITTIG